MEREGEDAAGVVTTVAIAVPVFAFVAGCMIGWGLIWDWVTGWWTPGWGNLFTVAIAAAAIGVSAWFNQRTLRRADERHDQGRRDATTDKLRNELVQYFTDIETCRAQARKLGKRIQELVATSLQDMKGDNDPEAMEAYRSAAYEAYRETLPEVHLRLAASEFKLVMLTTDREILSRTARIRTLLVEDKDDFELLIRADRERIAADTPFQRGATLLERHDNRISEIYALFVELGRYAARKFAYEAG